MSLKNITEITETEIAVSSMFHLKGLISMIYDITKSKAPIMSNLGKGTECIKILLYRYQKTCMNP